MKSQCINKILKSVTAINNARIFRKLMPRLHIRVCQLGMETKASTEVFSCCQGHAIYSLWER